mmetsp:Transcript_74357/g.177397  ORF Transcript_74357/g.177397 Transcript_74357/m.177397 type:complete len:289 (-) Transcript_74357:381-1247(-)
MQLLLLHLQLQALWFDVVGLAVDHLLHGLGGHDGPRHGGRVPGEHADAGDAHNQRDHHHNHFPGLLHVLALQQVVPAQPQAHGIQQGVDEVQTAPGEADLHSGDHALGAGGGQGGLEAVQRLLLAPKGRHSADGHERLLRHTGRAGEVRLLHLELARHLLAEAVPGQHQERRDAAHDERQLPAVHKSHHDAGHELPNGGDEVPQRCGLEDVDGGDLALEPRGESCGLVGVIPGHVQGEQGLEVLDLPPERLLRRRPAQEPIPGPAQQELSHRQQADFDEGVRHGVEEQ